jgi:hypothetical protein
MNRHLILARLKSFAIYEIDSSGYGDSYEDGDGFGCGYGFGDDYGDGSGEGADYGSGYGFSGYRSGDGDIYYYNELIIWENSND